MVGAVSGEDLLEALLSKKAFVVAGVADGDADEIVVVAGHQERFEHFGNRGERVSKLRPLVVGVTVQRENERAGSRSHSKPPA